MVRDEKNIPLFQKVFLFFCKDKKCKCPILWIFNFSKTGWNEKQKLKRKSVGLYCIKYINYSFKMIKITWNYMIDHAANSGVTFHFKTHTCFRLSGTTAIKFPIKKIQVLHQVLVRHPAHANCLGSNLSLSTY